MDSENNARPPILSDFGYPFSASCVMAPENEGRGEYRFKAENCFAALTSHPDNHVIYDGCRTHGDGRCLIMVTFHGRIWEHCPGFVASFWYWIIGLSPRLPVRKDLKFRDRCY